MKRYIFRRLLWVVPILWGTASLLFFLFNLLGDPTTLLVGQRSDVATESAIRKQLGLDLPIHQQYFLFLFDLSPVSVHPEQSTRLAEFSYVSLMNIQGYVYIVKMPYLRRSFQTNRLVWQTYMEHFSGTLILAVASMSIALFLGVCLGTVAALNKDTVFDKGLTLIAISGISLPSFWVAIFFVWLFAGVLGSYTGLPFSGYMIKENVFSSGYSVQVNRLFLPALTLGIRPLSMLFQLTRENMIMALMSDYVRTAKAKGLSQIAIAFKHALRNAINPVITSATGWLASLLAGAFFVEFIFNWHGVGKLTIDALMNNDFPLLMGCCLITAFFFILINILTDVLYAFIDPRVRF